MGNWVAFVARTQKSTISSDKCPKGPSESGELTLTLLSGGLLGDVWPFRDDQATSCFAYKSTPVCDMGLQGNINQCSFLRGAVSRKEGNTQRSTHSYNKVSELYAVTKPGERNSKEEQRAQTQYLSSESRKRARAASNKRWPWQGGWGLCAPQRD